MAKTAAISSTQVAGGGEVGEVENLPKTIVAVRGGLKTTNDLLGLTLAAVDDVVMGLIPVNVASVVVRGVGVTAKLVDLTARYGRPDASGRKVLELA